MDKPSPIEVMHSMLMKKFHEQPKVQNHSILINGMEFNAMIADCKTKVYAEYHGADKPVKS